MFQKDEITNWNLLCNFDLEGF